MSFRKCTREDPLTKRVRELYSANVVEAPRVGFDPLEVLARRGEHVERRGTLAPFLSGDTPLDLPDPVDAPAAELNGVVSTKIDANLGADLTGKLLSSLGVPIPSAELHASLWKGATEFSFEVRDVVEHSVNVGALGAALTGRTLSKNPAADIFVPPSDVRMHIVTRTLTSSQVVIRAIRSHGQTLDIGADAIASLLGSASAHVGWQREVDGAISFEGKRAATFAFSAVPCNVGETGTISLGLEIRDASYLDVPGADEGPIVVATHFPLVNSDGLLSVD